MKKIVQAMTLLSILAYSAAGFAKSISVTADTIDNAESKISRLAKEQNAKSYVITEARMDNNVHMTARLVY